MAIAPSPSENLWTEPESPANTDTPPQYPYNNVTQSESGHSIELDDTPDRERIRIQHGKSKNFIEMHPNGDQVCKILGDGYEIIAGRKNVEIRGACNITIYGDCNMNILGDKNETIKGDYNLEVQGNMIARSAGSKGMKLISDSDMSIQSNSSETGTLTLSAGDHIYVASDLEVAGAISADTISAESRINAGTGLYAGLFGVYSEGPINSLVSCAAPLGNFPVKTTTGYMSAVWMTDLVNTGFYNIHTHIGNRGFPTSPPNLPMI
jgi:hypothetical protein